MDYEPRIVKLEVTVDTLKEELTLLRGQVSNLDHKVDELHQYVDSRFSETHAEILQLRRDFEKLIYWVAGLTITNLLAIAGWALRAAGLF